MHWILQRNLISPIDLSRFERELQLRGIPYSLVSLIPFVHELVDELPTISDRRVFVYGSTGLGYVAKRCGWQPGYVDHNLDYELMLAKYGTRALNPAAVCASLGGLTHVWDKFFIRPTLDTKSFAGSVMTWQELEAFRTGLAKVADAPDVTLRLTDRVIMAPLTDIEAEFRVFVIGGKPVAWSRYKVADRLSVSAEVPRAVLAYVEDCIAQWTPNDAFTLDVALTSAGYKVIELNSANSSGVYACDVGKLVDAVNTYL